MRSNSKTGALFFMECCRLHLSNAMSRHSQMLFAIARGHPDMSFIGVTDVVCRPACSDARASVASVLDRTQLCKFYPVGVHRKPFRGPAQTPLMEPVFFGKLLIILVCSSVSLAGTPLARRCTLVVTERLAFNTSPLQHLKHLKC